MAGLKTKEEYNEMSTAVSLALSVLRKCKQNSWHELLLSMESGDPVTIKAMKLVDLSEYQQMLMGRFMPVLNMLSIKPPTVPAVCPACGNYILTGDTAPSRCLVTAGCTGKPYKVAAATATPDVQPEPEFASTLAPESFAEPESEAAFEPEPEPVEVEPAPVTYVEEEPPVRTVPLVIEEDPDF